MNPLLEATPACARRGAPTRVALPDTVPAELAGLRQWVAWQWEKRDGKPTKPPLNPRSGEYASTTDPATWGALQDALRFCEKHPRAAEVGFVFTKDDPYAGIDLDKCRNPQTGEIALRAQAIVDYLSSYTEVLPSGAGVKIFVRGALPAAARNGAIEAYDSGRYFTVTGLHVAGTPRTIEDRHAELQALYTWLKADGPDGRPNSVPPAPAPTPWPTWPRSPSKPWRWATGAADREPGAARVPQTTEGGG